MNLNALGEAIAKMRKAKDLSQDKLAALSGVARNTVNQLEQGEGNPTLSTIEALAKTLEVSPLEILDTAFPSLTLVRQHRDVEILKRVHADPLKRQYLLSVIFEDQSYVSPEAIAAALEELREQS